MITHKSLEVTNSNNDDKRTKMTIKQIIMIKQLNDEITNE